MKRQASRRTDVRRKGIRLAVGFAVFSAGVTLSMEPLHAWYSAGVAAILFALACKWLIDGPRYGGRLSWGFLMMEFLVVNWVTSAIARQPAFY